MLDSETKRRIDTARDILVGKLPDPKSQVEQITIALIYKFMDDMDKESEELGGKPVFFTGEFSQYAWSRIFDHKLGGHEIFSLYTEAIQKMNQNPNIPQLFRDIFKNAYLPYRDPETLKSFLKVINDFSYDHSERLGDAFEYLLSIMDSQGEAGQFRTPRHIIDFIVSIVSPSKNDTILDPACGTAGFLISSYKYILNKNTENGQLILTPEEKKKLTDNFVGYDISPDMVRLSLVNMYLHGYQNPHIYEYDALSSEERWNDFFDVIMANPPFMTPRGGIKPHKRFSIQANRSEVLFVDYIAEHLNVNGSGGVIVPEGIIFQSGLAYKALRKMLLEHYLYAVVSLPAGMFNPYSGIKTSILLMDKNLVKKSGKMIFVKINNDGFGLGAQRQEIRENDLPLAFEIICRFKNCAKEGKECELTELEKKHALILEKTEINDDYNLSVERYKKEDVYSGKWDLVELNQVFTEIKNGVNVEQSLENGKYRVTRIETISKGTVNLEKTRWTNDEVNENEFMREGDILLSHINSMEHLAKSAIFPKTSEKVIHGTNLVRFRPNTSVINPYYAIAIFKSASFIQKARSFAQKAVNQASIRTSDLKSIRIPLPPLDVQQQIVIEIESYLKIIHGAKQVIKSYKPTFDIEKDWIIAELGKTEIEIIDGDRGINYPQYTDFENEGYCLFLNTKNVTTDGFNFDSTIFISKEKDEKLRKGKLARNDLVLTTRGTVGNIALYDESIKFDHVRINSGMLILRPNTQVYLPKYLYYLFKSELIRSQIKSSTSGSAQPQLPIRTLINFKIPVPSIEIQKRIISRIDEENKLIDSNKKLVEIFGKRIEKKMMEVWGENE